MSYSFNKVWIHAVWSTKERRPLISSKIEMLVHEYMNNQFKLLGCDAKTINGSDDHVHCLFILSLEKSLAEVMKQVKGSTSHFINSTGLSADKFAWQTGYAAFTVSEDEIEKLADYINTQKKHHANESFADEFRRLLKENGIFEFSKN